MRFSDLNPAARYLHLVLLQTTPSHTGISKAETVYMTCSALAVRLHDAAAQFLNVVSDGLQSVDATGGFLHSNHPSARNTTASEGSMVSP